MLRIGELSKIKGISTKTLRHYDKIGLLRPMRVDSQTNYRLYSEEQVEDLSKILILKKVGFSLEYIKELMHGGLTVESLIDVLKTKRIIVKEEIEEKTEQLDVIQSYIHELINWKSPLINKEIRSSNSILKYPASKHYDLLATIEPDPPMLKKYMAQWDGEPFFNQLKGSHAHHFLEVGIGLGRVAETVLKAGGKVTGIDISSESLDCAGQILNKYMDNLVLVNSSIEDFETDQLFDASYSVLTFCHVKDKRKALTKMVSCTKPGGQIILSIEMPDINYEESIWVDNNVRYKPEYWPNNPVEIVKSLNELGCSIIHIEDLFETLDSESSQYMDGPIAKLIVAVKKE